MVDILIVEDNKEISELLADFLKKEGFLVSVAPSGEEAEPSESNEQTENVPEEAAKPTGAAYTISDEVIVDDENCTFTITKAEDDKIWGFTLKVFCENKTEDKTLMFAIGNASVNGYMVDPAWAEEVAPGKKSNGEVTFSSSAFEDIGITAADEVIFSLRVYDSEKKNNINGAGRGRQ